MNQSHTDDDSRIPKAIQDWFQGLQKTPGKRAELRRCETLDEVFFCQGYWDLRNALAEAMPSGLNQRQNAGIAALAGVMSGSRDWYAPNESMGKAFAKDGGLSALRFRRILTHKKMADLFIPLSRALRLIKFKFSPTVLAKDLLFWNESTRKRWAFDFYRQINESKN